MSSRASSTIPFSESDNYSTLSESMTRNQLEGFSIYQHDVILQQHQMIRDRDYELDAGDAFRDHQAGIIEQQQMILLRREAELAEVQRTLQAQRQLVTACTDNMMYLIRMIEERDQTNQDKDRVIAGLSNEVRDLQLQRLQEDLEEDEDKGDVAEQPPISPLILPDPALPISSSPVSSLSSSSSSSPSSPLLPRHHPTHGLPTTRATATRKRDRPAAFNGPIETPGNAEQNGRPSHRSKRARHHNNGGRLGHDGSSPFSEESVYPASDAAAEPTPEEGPGQEWAEGLWRAVERSFPPVHDGF